ncbi:MAG: insulinase family protein [Ruminococcus sp.]|nr:insulinase family protein [Oscillospiraceae bacterium]MDY4413931.1 insulinase family protein [Ruminococcus sp.]
MTYERIRLAENIGFSEIIDSKFKTGVLEIDFITPLSPETSSQNASAICSINMTNSKYPSITEFSSKLNSLYGSNIFSKVNRISDFQINSIGASWLDSKYALEGEDIETETVKILLDCIFSPDIKDNAFNQNVFEIAKKDIQAKIDSEINNKRGYAVRQASKIAFRGEPAENNSYGTSETLKEVTSESAYSALQNLVINSQIEISYVSAQKNDKIRKILSDVFGKLKRNGNTYKFISFSPIKPSPEEFTETLDVNQSKMVLVFKTKKDDKYAMKMLSALYGETPFSKLFANVREKMSLCYYCSSSFSRAKNCIFVDCGVETKNIETARNAIIGQLDEIISGNFSDEDMQNVLLALENSFSGIGDTAGSYINWYKSAVYEGEYLTPEQTLEKYRNVTRDRIIECAKSLVLDTVYVMKSKEE